VNDRDCFVANFWRAVQQDAELVASHADWPVNEADLHSRHRWLCDRSKFREKMLADPDYYDAKIAGWWVWGISQWIGSGWCSKPEWSGRGRGGSPRGIHIDLKRPRVDHLGLIRQGDSIGVWRKKPKQDRCDRGGENILEWMKSLSGRLRRVRVLCGEWNRLLTPACTHRLGGGTLTGVLLDPPYDLRVVRSRANGSDGAAPSDRLYSLHDNDLSAKVRSWALKNAENPSLRIALCGAEGEHEMPSDWRQEFWRAPRGYSKISRREVIWFSPHCLKSRSLFDELEAYDLNHDKSVSSVTLCPPAAAVLKNGTGGYFSGAAR
jgi:DNA adenine methylase